MSLLEAVGSDVAQITMGGAVAGLVVKEAFALIRESVRAKSDRKSDQNYDPVTQEMAKNLAVLTAMKEHEVELLRSIHDQVRSAREISRSNQSSLKRIEDFVRPQREGHGD